MMSWFKVMIHGLVQWTIHWAYTPFGAWALFAIAFAESSFFPIPPDILLIALCLLRPEDAFWFAAVCSAGSVLGGMFGYGLGLGGGRPLLVRMFRGEKIEAVRRMFAKYEVWAVAIAGFTPIPYKVFTIASGVFAIPFFPFVWASLASRSARFFMVATALYFWGETVKGLLERYFELFTLAFMLLLIGGFLAIRWFVKRHHAHPQAPREASPDEAGAPPR